MAEESILSDEFIRQLISVGEVDILIGIPTHNDAKTVGPAIQAIQAGLLKSFPRERAVIINTDGGSGDGTPEIVQGAAISDVHRGYNGYTLRTLHAISTQYARTPSDTLAFRTILSAAELLRARACMVLPGESCNIEPAWMDGLLRPVYRESFDLVTPTYCRHKFEGVLVTNLIYPMMRALYGRRVREPYAPEFACSGRFGSQFLLQHNWNQGLERDDPRMDLTISALAGGCRIHQTYLGARQTAKPHSRDLVNAMRQTIGTLFSCLEGTFPSWSKTSGSEPISTTGPEFEVRDDVMRVNRKQLKQMFSEGVAELGSILESILTPSTLQNLRHTAGSDEASFRFPAELWVRTVYEFAASYYKSVINRDHVVQALVPIYRGRMFSFLTENRTASSEEVARNIESLCLEFERLKPYLLELWNGRK